MAVTELHPDAIICPECGHDCDERDCGNACICAEEYDSDSYEYETGRIDWRDYWDE